MKAGLLVLGGASAGIWAYDQVANKTGWPSIWAAIFSNPTLVNYFFDELWLLVLGIVLTILALTLR